MNSIFWIGSIAIFGTMVGLYLWQRSKGMEGGKTDANKQVEEYLNQQKEQAKDTWKKYQAEKKKQEEIRKHSDKILNTVKEEMNRESEETIKQLDTDIEHYENEIRYWSNPVFQETEHTKRKLEVEKLLADPNLDLNQRLKLNQEYLHLCKKAGSENME